MAALRRECLAARWKFTRSTGNILLHKAYNKGEASREADFNVEDFIGEVEKDPWGLTFKIITKRFQRQDRSSCVVRRTELFTLKELGRAGGRLKANTAPGIDGVPNEILKEVIAGYPEIFLEAFNSCRSSTTGKAEVGPVEERNQTFGKCLIL